jgi:acyl-CoA synthetase (AMP-forming)/AMP-acid ligase II
MKAGKLETVVSIVESVNSCSDEQDDVIYSIDDLLLQRMRTIPDEPLVGYPAAIRGGSDYVYYTATDLHRFADESTKFLTKQGLHSNVSSSTLYPVAAKANQCQ